MDCWAEAYGTSLYLQEAQSTTGQMVSQDIKKPRVIRKAIYNQSRSSKPIRGEKVNVFIRRESTLVEVLKRLQVQHIAHMLHN